MTTDPRETAHFRATANGHQGFGPTPREALDRLLSYLPHIEDTLAPIVIWPFNQGDAFFTEAQQSRLQELKARRDTLSPAEQEELEQLVEAAFDATVSRTQTIRHTKS